MIPKHYARNTVNDIGFSVIDMDKYIKAHLSSGNHRHNFYEILIIFEGDGIHGIDFINYVIRNNSISFLPPGQVHNLKDSSIKNCTILIFNVDFIYKTSENSTLLKQLDLIFNQSPILDLDKNGLNELRTTLSIIETELKKETLNRDILFHSLNLLLFQILSFYKENQKIPSQTTAISKERYFHFLELVESNYCKEHSVQYYANRMNIHPKRLNEVTQFASGENALYLVQKRILVEAKRLLFYNTLSIKEIAYQLGFEDVSYFSKFFLKNIGLRPSAFKESNPKSTG